MMAFIITSIILMTLHELAHVVTAKAANMRIEKIGFTIKPFPHVYVSAINSTVSDKRNVLFLISGNAITWLCFVILMIYGIRFKIDYLVYLAFAVQLIFEMNPFFSDYTKLFCYYKYMKWLKIQFREGKTLSYKEIDEKRLFVIQKYMYSHAWYIHFFVWTCVVIVLFSPHLLPSVIRYME